MPGQRTARGPHELRYASQSGAAMSWVIGVLAMLAIVWIVIGTRYPVSVEENPAAVDRTRTTGTAGEVSESPGPMATLAPESAGERSVTHAALGTVAEPLAIDAGNVAQLGDHIGRIVVITGPVEEVIDDSAFIMHPSPNGENEGVGIIINPNQLPLVRGAERVRVQGVVRSFDPRDLEATYGVDLSHGAFDDWRGRTVIVATDVAPEAE